MKNVFLWGFCDESEAIALRLKASDELNIAAWISTHPEATLSIFDCFTGRISYQPYEGKSLPYQEVLWPQLSTFMDMFSRHERGTGLGNFHEVLNLFNLFSDVLATLLIDNRIDAVVFSNVPHEGADILLYALAEAMGLKTLILHQSPFPNQFFYFARPSDIGLISRQPLLRPPQPYSIGDIKGDVDRLPRLRTPSLLSADTSSLLPADG